MLRAFEKYPHCTISSENYRWGDYTLTIEKPVVYIKEPYSVLLPKSLTSKDRINPKDFTAFDETVVLFKGFGKTTVISFPDGTATRMLEIPNDHIIVEDR